MIDFQKLLPDTRFVDLNAEYLDPLADDPLDNMPTGEPTPVYIAGTLIGHAYYEKTTVTDSDDPDGCSIGWQYRIEPCVSPAEFALLLADPGG